jgi:RecG-like helicase/REP element-mobilizing transposase RayT
MRMFDVVLAAPEAHALSLPLVCRWFNSPWVEKAVVHGQRLVVYGKPKRSGSNIVMAHPEFEVVEDDAETSMHLDRIVPIHRAGDGISPRVIRRLIWQVLEHLDEKGVTTIVPRELDPRSRSWALRQIHFPDDLASRDAARRHLVLEEFFILQLSVAAKRHEVTRQAGAAHCGAGELLRRLHDSLPFPLTGAQQRAIEEIRADLAAPRPMNRLLHGDVGSGKTLVALSAMLLCVESGHQAALMAPTQILAEQHYLNLRKLCDPLGIRVALRTGSRSEEAQAMELFDHAPDTSAQKGGSESTDSRRSLPPFEKPWAKYMVSFSTRDRRSLSPSSRDLVLESILYWKDRRYTLFAACVMPDHVHLLLEPMVKDTANDGQSVFFSLSEILHTLKSCTAHLINKAEVRAGSLWEAESVDRLIRSPSDLEEKYQYVVRSPWNEGLVGLNENYRWVWHPDWAWAHPSPSESFLAGRQEPQAGGLCSPDSPVPLSNSAPQIFVGTHALLYETAGFTRLGLAVIDEQHKFGVLQRARLREQGAVPDVLVMTATPIPRTLTMTLYGDLDVSTLDELPKGRGKIITAVREEAKLPEAVKFIREHLEQGRQAYVVYPLIDESEKLEAKAAAAEFEKWRGFLAPLSCELLHGRVPPEEKDAIMDRFRRGETKALIATTVIEVGIDVPNANIMLIENAERFGLAQLHQLRGRIGRGEHKSYCVLLTGKKADDEAKQKLAIFERTTDGFEIAEEDLRIRGPGDLLGTAQSGLPPLKIGDVFSDAELMKLARNAAFLLFERDPALEQPEHRHLREFTTSKKLNTLAQVS